MSHRARRIASALVVAFAAIVIALVLLELLASCSGPAPLPSGPAPSQAPSTARERDLVELTLERAWDEHRFGCGTPTQIVTDALAPLVQTVGGTDRLTAVLAVQGYRRVRCPGR